MPSEYEKFWTHESFAVVGHTAKRGFPKLTYGALRQQGRKVFAVDPSASEIEGDKAYPDLASLPEKVEAVVLEVPKEEGMAIPEQPRTERQPPARRRLHPRTDPADLGEPARLLEDRLSERVIEALLGRGLDVLAYV